MSANCKRLNDTTLARLFFRRLLQGYSCQGIHLGRSIRGGLLEGYTDLTPIPRVRDPDSYYELDLCEEALRRAKLPGHSLRIKALPKPDKRKRVAYRCIAGLRLWYEWDAAGNDPLVRERQRIEAVCALLPLPGLPWKTDIDGLKRLVLEAKELHWEIFKPK